MRDQQNRNIGRRKFFSRITIGSLGAALFSSLPIRLFAKKNDQKIQISIHPSAVKRNNKV